MKTVAIIQARMTSTRLPGKVMVNVAGKPLIHYVVTRAQRARSLDLVAAATSDRPTDDVIARFCEAAGVPYYRGSEEDVLDRYYQAARHFQADVIVRLTADCPLLDPVVIDRVVSFFHSGEFDYVSNTLELSFPDGLDTEVIRREALERAWHEARLTSEREHVTAYICKHTELFRLANVRHEEDLSALRWAVDEPQDLEFVRRVYTYLGSSPSFGMAEVIALLRDNPELRSINAQFERNEGYQKSLREDTLIEKGS